MDFAPQEVSTTVTITEDIPNGLSVDLTETDLPFGKPREVTAFESGGKTEIAEDGFYNPGAEQPVLQVMQTRERPMVIRGAFRDHQWGVIGHARAQRDLITQIWKRANPVRISWDGDERIGLLWEPKWGEQGTHDIEYELTFFIALGVDGSSSPVNDQPENEVTSIEDLRAQMQAAATAQAAAQLGLALSTFAAAMLSNGWNTVSSALDSLGTLTAVFESTTFATPQHAISAANRVMAGAEDVRSAAASFQADLETMGAEVAMVAQDAISQMTWWSSLYASEVLLDQLLDAMRTIRAQALAEVRKSTRLYRVQQGDTLESIARIKLGSRARAQDLIRTDQLIVGSYIRIPEAK